MALHRDARPQMRYPSHNRLTGQRLHPRAGRLTEPKPHSSPPSRLRRSTLNASSKSRPAGWTTPAPATLQRSASRRRRLARARRQAEAETATSTLRLIPHRRRRHRGRIALRRLVPPAELPTTAQRSLGAGRPLAACTARHRCPRRRQPRAGASTRQCRRQPRLRRCTSAGATAVLARATRARRRSTFSTSSCRDTYGSLY